MTVRASRRPELPWLAATYNLALERIRAGWLPVAVAACFVAIWWITTISLDNRRLFPTPIEVGDELFRIASGETPFGSSYGHFGATMGRLAAAFLFSFSVGASVGILAGRLKTVFDLVDNIVWIFLAVPSVVWVFIFAIAIGRSDLVPIAALSALLTPNVLIIVAEGAKSVPKDLLEMADAFKVGRLQRFTGIYLPYLVPYLVGAARVSFALGIKIVLVAEVIGLSAGVGYLVVYARDAVFMAPIVAWGVIFIAVGLLVDYSVFRQIDRRVAKWRPPQKLRSGTTI